MIRLILAALLILAATNVEARQRHKPTGLHPECNITMPCEKPYASTPDQARITRGRWIARSFGIGVAIEKPVRKARKHVIRHHVAEPRQRVAAVSPMIGGIVAPLASKVAEIVSSCGSQVISSVRHTYIAGTRRISLHASGKAVDLAGNPSCMYALLHGWAGGYSIDYASVRHLHLSYDLEGGREMGSRFVHGGGGYRHKYAHRHYHRRYASR